MTSEETTDQPEPPDRRLEEIIAHLMRAIDAGQRLDRDEWLTRHPDFAGELREFFEQHERVEKLVRPLRRAAAQVLHVRCPHCHHPIELLDDAPLTDISCPTCGSNFSLVGDRTASHVAAPRSFGHFELLDCVGTGQFGSVWKARDTKLDRTVAIKIPRNGRLGEAQTEMFVRDARAAAQLRHPNIVGVHEVGKQDDTIYIVSDFISGATLKERIAAARLSPREAAQLCLKIARALHHAHEAGVIHRDLKPSNIMLDAGGEPHLVDFGLAKREAGEITMTVEGQILGTPAYMSPEQARGEGHTVDRRADIYSLGVILFELLTGELPFRGDKQMLIVQILNDDPPSPHKLNNRVPRDLETICLKCLEREPQKRYSTAVALSGELQRYVDGESILARPSGLMSKGWRWCKRRPVVAGLSACVAVVLLAGIAVSSYFAFRANESAWHFQHQFQRAEGLLTEKGALLREQGRLLDEKTGLVGSLATSLENEQTATTLANKRAEMQRRISYDSRVALAHISVLTRRVEQARAHLDSCPPDLRCWGWRYINRQCRRELLNIPESKLATISHDGQRLVFVSQDDAIHVWNLLDDGEPTSFQPAFGKILSANITPAGDKLVCLSENKLARCDLATGEVEVLAVADESVDRGAMSADGRWHAVAAGSGRVRLLDCGTGEVRKVELAGASDDSERIVFVGGGDEPIAGAYSGETVDIWNLNTGQVRASVQVGRARIAFSADGRYLAWASPDRYLGRVVHVRDVAAGETKQLVGHSDGVYALAFSPNGERLATVGLDRALRLWNVPRTQDVLALPTPWESRRLASLNFSPDGRLLFASNGEALSVLDVSEDWSVTTLAGHSRAVYSIDLVPGGEFLVSAGGTYGEKTGEVILWNLETKQEVRRFQEQGDAIFCAACSPDGKYIASSSRNGVLNVSRLEDASIVFTLTGSYAVRFSPNGRKIAVADNSGAVTIWDLESRQAIRRIDAAGVRGLAFSPDGKLLAAACNRGSERAGVRIWEVATGDRIHDFTSDAKYAWRVAFNNDGTRVAAGVDRTVKVWNLTSGKEEFSLEGHAGTVYSAAFNASGDRLVSGSGTNYNAAPNPGPGSSSFFVHIPGEVKLWDVSTGQEILTLNVPVLEVYDVAFSHDDKFLVAACGSYLSFEQQGDVRIWETATGEEAFLHAVRRSRGASISSSD